jgi:hypothetical protein
MTFKDDYDEKNCEKHSKWSFLFREKVGSKICSIYPNISFSTASANPRPAGRMWPLKLFSAALGLPLEIDNLEENQQIH